MKHVWTLSGVKHGYTVPVFSGGAGYMPELL